MAKESIIHLYVWSGDAHRARTLVSARYPGAVLREFPHLRLREGNFATRLRLLQGFRGHAIVFYFASLAELKYRRMIECLHLLHSCDRTILCDGSGAWHELRSIDVFRSAPAVLLSLLRDATTFLFWRLYLGLWPRRVPPELPVWAPADQLIAYLVPGPTGIGEAGGAISHIRGLLGGLRASGIRCRVFSGAPLAQEVFPTEMVGEPGRSYFFWEAVMLSWNFAFARKVQALLAAGTPAILYQRHGRLSVAGALLSRRLHLPLILEYNGSEAWMADHWDPTFFRGLTALCEEASLRSAARIVVVSQVLKTDLLQRGFPEERIRVNPNGVDGAIFCPRPGRHAARTALQIEPAEVLVCFVGSFSLWHGIQTLQLAILQLLSEPQPCRLRFLLVGDGLLREEMRGCLAACVEAGEVIFTGSLPTDQVVACLDASDILVSPHIPMVDGSRFFGSPTKLFEYMAMGKAIVASRLEQLAEVLTHGETGWLVTPGDAHELAQAILRLAMDPARRAAMGHAARATALQRHSWTRNVAIALQQSPVLPPTGPDAQGSEPAMQTQAAATGTVSAMATRELPHSAGSFG